MATPTTETTPSSPHSFPSSTTSTTASSPSSTAENNTSIEDQHAPFTSSSSSSTPLSSQDEENTKNSEHAVYNTVESSSNNNNTSPFSHPLDTKVTSTEPSTTHPPKIVTAATTATSTTDVVSAPLPVMPPMVRSASTPSVPTGKQHQQRQFEQQRHELGSTPISLPIIVQPSPTNPLQTIAKTRGPTRTPSPNLTPSSPLAQSAFGGRPPLSSAGSSASLHLRYNNHQLQQQQASSPTFYSAPLLLRPDSVCTFPDSSPLMAPNVLAAVDARLWASAQGQDQSRGRRANGSGPASSCHSLRPQNSSDSVLLQTPHSNNTNNSKASSLAPVITHHSVLENTDAITSREQLYDILNREDDDDEEEEDGGAERDQGNSKGRGSNHSAFHFDKPRPKFHGHGNGNSFSSQSSRRTSMSSSLAHSGIELNHKRSSLSLSGADQKSGMRMPTVPTNAAKGSSLRNDKSARANHSFLHKDSVASLSSMHSNETGLAQFGGKSAWLESKRRSSRRWRSICCVVGILAFAGAIAGIVLGIVGSKGKVDGLAPPTDPKDPHAPPVKPPITEYTPDPSLRKAFYGVDYNPAKTMMPWCGATLQDVIDDMILISQIANRVRLYGVDCGQADLTFQAIKLLKIRMGVVLTLWVDKDPVTYQRQYDTLFKVLDKHGVDMVEGVSVGNEVLFRDDQTLETLSTMMATVRAELQRRYNRAVPIPVFSSEIGNNLNAALAAVSDELSGNLHPYFSDTPAEKAAEWTFQQYENLIVNNPTPTGINGSISEVGWPSSPASAVYKQYAVPGVANMQTLVDTFVCRANQAKIPYYWFEFRDEPWKTDPKVPVEAFWGIFDRDNKLKIKIPDCLAS
ncbi:hypothetical protein BGZ94_001188 [Podila epigama]|nr:hypothetical protein BGZ94_001188 [Podila epigama]